VNVTMTKRSDTTDVLILGGGPAGLAAAIALRQKNIDCLVVEAQGPAIDKGCGEGLMPDALAAMRELGIEITERHGHRFRGIRFRNAEHQVDADFPNGIGIGVRRTKLHGLIAARAHAVGVSVLWGSRAKLLNRRSAVVGGRKICFRYLVGADGQASGVRRWAGLDKTRRESIRFGFRRHYNISPWSEYAEVHWREVGQVYLTPVGPKSVCVAFITRNPALARGNFLDAYPEVAATLKDVPAISPLRGGISAARKLHRVVHHTIALIGDASGSPDAITGEGLAVSFRQSLALASAMEQGNLELYARAHRKIGSLSHAMSSLMLTMDRWPALQARVMKALSSHPVYFQQLLSAHVGAGSLTRFALRRGPQLGWSLLEAGF
jgi:menaquinone-9 beta-reductase